MDLTVHGISPCISDGNLTLKVGDVVLRMDKISSNPLCVLEDPLELPLPGVYENSLPMTDGSLINVTLTVREGAWSLLFALPDGSFLSYSIGATSRDISRRCFWFEGKRSRRKLFIDEPRLPADHFLKTVYAKEAGICQGPKSQTYLVLGDVSVLLKRDESGSRTPGTTEYPVLRSLLRGDAGGQSEADISEYSEDSPSAAKRRRVSPGTSMVDSPAVMERLSQPNTFKNIEADNDQSTGKMRLSATAGYDEPGQALPFNHEVPRAYSPSAGYSGTGAPREFRESSPSSSLTRSLQSTRSVSGTLGAATGVAYEGALAEPEPVLDETTLEWMVDNYEDLIQWAEGLDEK
ncbi:hypothetical protein FOZ62_022453 [Perkinsus olseni]|uniref:Uncharacterized protein n=1 Tax=Perkinsus olseni TaxID=32597 RepID=A0A7J6TWU5_PEROL|nr:hypothetical protein FOZ62_022453 [Perkinsus olseni]